MVVTGLLVYFINRDNPEKVRAETIEPPSTWIAAGTRGSEMNPVKGHVVTEESRELPPTERSLISGEGALDSASYFDCWVTNRSSWVVTELQFRIAAGQTEGSTRWERNYREYVQLPPGTARHITFKVTDGNNAETRWEIIGARGVWSR